MLCITHEAVVLEVTVHSRPRRCAAIRGCRIHLLCNLTNRKGARTEIARLPVTADPSILAADPGSFKNTGSIESALEGVILPFLERPGVPHALSQGFALPGGQVAHLTLPTNDRGCQNEGYHGKW